MSDQLQDLLQRVYEEGVNKAKAEAEQILDKAKAEAANIVQKAQAEADRIFRMHENKQKTLRGTLNLTFKWQLRILLML